MKNFKDLRIWQQGMTIVNHTYDIAEKLPNNERYGITSQICRASVSIPSNIAEGYSRTSNKDMKRFFEMSLGSSYELETQFLVIKNRGMAATEEVDAALNALTEEQKMLNSYISKIKSTNLLTITMGSALFVVTLLLLTSNI